MSYDIYLTESKTNKTIVFDEKHNFKGGTYVIGGTNEAHLNITYNYGVHYRKTMGEKGIRTIYGMTGSESIPILTNAIDALGDDTDPDYWKPTEGNAKLALVALLAFASKRPDGIWVGD